MGDWILVLIPLSVLALTSLIRFVGCSFDPGGLGTGIDYGATVLGNPDLVGYWRLGEVVGPTANDEKGANPGAYRTAALAADAVLKSPAAPGTLAFGQPGLLNSDPARTAVGVDGGYVEVPFAAALNPASFSLEAWVHPEWDPGESGVFRCVLAAREDVGGTVKRGYTLYAGPNLATPGDATAYWQVWVGEGGPAWQPLIGPPVLVGMTSHLVATYDGMTLRLYVDGPNDDAGTPDAQMPATYVPNTSRPLYIGMGRPETPGPDGPRFPFKGRLQEVAIYNTALPATTVADHTWAGNS